MNNSRTVAGNISIFCYYRKATLYCSRGLQNRLGLFKKFSTLFCENVQMRQISLIKIQDRSRRARIEKNISPNQSVAEPNSSCCGGGICIKEIQPLRPQTAAFASVATGTRREWRKLVESLGTDHSSLARGGRIGL